MLKKDLPQLLYLLSACRMWQRHYEAMRYERPANLARALVIPLRRAPS
jgi:hypothetical protein